MPALFDLTWKPSAAQADLPTDVYPTLGPAVYRGDAYSIRFVLTNDATPYVPEGTLIAQIRPERLKANATPGDPIADFAVTVGGDDGNEVVIALTGDTLDGDELVVEGQTSTLPDSWVWDIQETFDDASPRTWFTGKGKAWGDVTRQAAP